MEKHITSDVLDLWFSSTTRADNQLNSVINTNKYERIVPTFEIINNHLFKCNNVYENHKIRELASPIGYSAHIGQATLNMIETLLGKRPKFGIEVGSFIGSSATILGNYLKQNEGVLLCIDTWCGDINNVVNVWVSYSNGKI